MRTRGAITLWIASALCAGAWSCNAVLGINDPEHALDAGTQPDASSEEAAPQPDGPLGDTIATDDHQDSQLEAQTEAGDEADSAACGEPGLPCCAGSCTTGTCCAEQCVDTTTDPTHCGGCDTKCDLGCSASACITALQVGLGDEHSCAVLSDKSVRCWGRGIDGELGNGAYTDQSKPQVVMDTGTTPLANASRVGGAYVHTCVLLGDKTLRCFGENSKGQLGDGTGMSKNTADTGPKLTNVTDMSLGSEHMCAIASASVWCWGYNSYKQVSPGSDSALLVPAMVNLTGTPTTVSCGYQHSCAGLGDGHVWCWGFNDQGELGNNTTTGSPNPVQVQVCTSGVALAGVQSLAAGARHMCAIKADNTVWCWGDGSGGQVGDGKTDYHSCAVQTVGLSTAVQIAAGTNHSCALMSNKALFCWGYNSDGQVGDGTILDVKLPTQVLDNVTAIDLGDTHTCAARVDGTVWCWGSNARGQLGDGTKKTSLSPKKVVW